MSYSHITAFWSHHFQNVLYVKTRQVIRFAEMRGRYYRVSNKKQMYHWYVIHRINLITAQLDITFFWPTIFPDMKLFFCLCFSVIFIVRQWLCELHHCSFHPLTSKESRSWPLWFTCMCASYVSSMVSHVFSALNSWLYTSDRPHLIQTGPLKDS